MSILLLASCSPSLSPQVNEYEVTLRRPGPGVSTGSGTVGGARVISIDEVTAVQYTAESLCFLCTAPNSNLKSLIVYRSISPC